MELTVRILYPEMISLHLDGRRDTTLRRQREVLSWDSKHDLSVDHYADVETY